MKYTKGQINTLRQRLDLWCILMHGAGANRDLTDSQVVDNYERLGLNKNDEVIEETPAQDNLALDNQNPELEEKVVKFASLQDQIDLEFDEHENYGDKILKVSG